MLKRLENAFSVRKGFRWKRFDQSESAVLRRWLLFICFLDLFGVSLVVPMLPKIFKLLKGDPNLWGVTASAYSVAQIIGSIMLGGASDRLGRRGMLVLSMLGAAISYALVGFATSVTMLVVSRMIVGIFKQTQTVTTALTADITVPDKRAEAVAHVGAALTLGWTVGQVFGGHMSEYFGDAVPIGIAVLLFVINAYLVQVSLPGADYMAGVLIPAVNAAAKAKKGGDMKALIGTMEALLFNGVNEYRPLKANLESQFGRKLTAEEDETVRKYSTTAHADIPVPKAGGVEKRGGKASVAGTTEQKRTQSNSTGKETQKEEPQQGRDAGDVGVRTPSTWENAKALFRSPATAQVLFVYLLYTLAFRSFESTKAFYLAERFSLTPKHLGDLGGFSSLVGMLVQTSGVSALVEGVGEKRLVLQMLWLTAVVCTLECLPVVNIYIYSAVIMPIRAIIIGVIRPCFTSLFLSTVPSTSRGAALGGLDMLNSGIGILAPLIGGWLLATLGPQSQFLVGTVVFFALGVSMLVLPHVRPEAKQSKPGKDVEKKSK